MMEGNEEENQSISDEIDIDIKQILQNPQIISVVKVNQPLSQNHIKGKKIKDLNAKQKIPLQKQRQAFNNSILEIEESPEPLRIQDLQTPDQQYHRPSSDNNKRGNKKIQAYTNGSNSNLNNNNNQSKSQITLMSISELSQLDQDVKKNLFDSRNQNSSQYFDQTDQEQYQMQNEMIGKNQQELQMIQNLKDLQMRKKRQNQAQHDNSNNLIVSDSQTIQDQYRDEGSFYAKKRAHDLEIIEEQVTLSSKENSFRLTKQLKSTPPKKNTMQNFNNQSKQKILTSAKLRSSQKEQQDLSNFSTQSNAPKSVSQTVSNFMMRRSNSQSQFKSGKKKSQTQNQQAAKNIGGLINYNNSSLKNSLMIDANNSLYKLDQSYINNSSILGQSYLPDSANTSTYLKQSASQPRFNIQSSNILNMSQDNQSQQQVSPFLLNDQIQLNDQRLIQIAMSQKGKRPFSSKKKGQQISNPNKPPMNKQNIEVSPYNSQYHVKILHDYFDIDCQQVGLSKEGMPMMKIRKINRQTSQSKLSQNDSMNTQAQLLTHNSSQTSLKKSMSRELSQSNLSNQNQYQMLNSMGSLNQNNYDHFSSQQHLPHQQMQQQQQQFVSDNQIFGSIQTQKQIPNQGKVQKQQKQSNQSFQRFKNEIEKRYLSKKVNYQTAKNIINTNHNSYVCFGVNIIQKSDQD
ncbi:UNKNOWN [Stylonychia lemnae]|uniref:Uncharacterized protein n=1 Tax=Stylonychia lemnae TaxID=5949 RepID=A0A078AEY5_STYLE|nr:UNKNOWN [Stylonychia lemnae]|eukprot:CDW80785.1 UNKNOWN [Stylonychia lemnae]